ncbi:MAG TPA: AraC family transcriptional regulator [Ktedonobacteraceae bacterium]|nr:AraC family transcriptional regulator [Ktedonobacteraceae bacterium]
MSNRSEPGKPDDAAKNVGEITEGTLRVQTGDRHFQSSQYMPEKDISFFVEHYWTVEWDFRDQEPYLSQNLPHPSVHLSFEPDCARVVGVVKGRFSYLLKDTGRVFGVRFKPGAFYPFVQVPVSLFTDKSLGLLATFGRAGKQLEIAMLARESVSTKIELIETFLRERLPERDASIALIEQIIDHIIMNREVTRVDDLEKQFGLGKRSLQRLFSQYVGVPPKWIIRRYRLHQAAERMMLGEERDWSQLALDLGYFDQAHFIKDFKTVIGRAPAEYAKENGIDPLFSSSCTMLYFSK